MIKYTQKSDCYFINQIDDTKFLVFVKSILKNKKFTIKRVSTTTGEPSLHSICYKIEYEDGTIHLLMVKDYDCYLLNFVSLKPIRFTKKYIKFMISQFGKEYENFIKNRQNGLIVYNY